MYALPHSAHCPRCGQFLMKIQGAGTLSLQARCRRCRAFAWLAVHDRHVAVSVSDQPLHLPGPRQAAELIEELLRGAARGVAAPVA